MGDEGSNYRFASKSSTGRMLDRVSISCSIFAVSFATFSPITSDALRMYFSTTVRRRNPPLGIAERYFDGLLDRLPLRLDHQHS